MPTTKAQQETNDNLCRYLARSASEFPDHTALEEANENSISYSELDRLSDRVRDLLQSLGVRSGDRVGINLPKSIDSVTAIFGVLKVGAAYIPVDSKSPAERNAFIMNDCGVRVVFVQRGSAAPFREELARLGHQPELVELSEERGGDGLRQALETAQPPDDRLSDNSHDPSSSDLAYILYTSGSTGLPKGVMLSHLNATSFVDWCSEILEPTAQDRFSSHAPFHFDLSVLDLFVSIKHGATLVLIDDELSKNPAAMVQLVSDKRLTVWYSTPSVLSLMVQFGKLDQVEGLDLRLVLFAGEVFPVKHLRRLREILSEPRLFNLYGPTETNVCTYLEIPFEIPPERSEPYPIGRVCSHLWGRVVDEEGVEVAEGEEGELWIAGPSVMQGYWNLPDRTEESFVERDGKRWYRTGDLVIDRKVVGYDFLGRRDRMIKRRGYRVEPGEIEAAMYRHPAVLEAAVVALSGQDGVVIKCFYTTHEQEQISLIELKRFCAENLPSYMIPDLFTFVASLPKTSTDKIDYQGLEEIA